MTARSAVSTRPAASTSTSVPEPPSTVRATAPSASRATSASASKSYVSFTARRGYSLASPPSTSRLRCQSGISRPRQLGPPRGGLMRERLDTSYHKRMLAARMEDAEFREEYERARSEIAQVDAVVRQLDDLREKAGLTKAELARHIGRDPSSIRRLFTARSNPELRLVASIAEDLGADIRIVPRNVRASSA